MQNNQIMLIKAKRAIQELQAQLAEVIKANQQQKELIRILSDDKNFYMNKYRQQEDQLERNRTQFDKKNSLISSLSQQNKYVVQQNNELLKQLSERDFLLDAQDKQVQRMRQQKNILQNQWNRIVKSVKAKLCALQYKNQSPKKTREYSDPHKKQTLQDKKHQPKKDRNCRVKNIIKTHDQIESILKLKKEEPQKQNNPYYYNAQKLKFEDLTEQQKAM